MKKTVNYSILKYKPSVLVDESINAGILLEDEQTGYGEFYATTNRERLMNFDTSLTSESIDLVFDSISDEIRRELNNNPSQFKLEQFIKYFINAFHFSRIEHLYVDDVEDALPLLKKQYLIFDSVNE